MQQEKIEDPRHVELELEDYKHSYSVGHDMSAPQYSLPSQTTMALPPIPWKIFALSIFLTIAGITLIVLGFVDDVRKTDPGNGLSFLITGALVCTPGIFYTVKLIVAWQTTDPEERMRILDDVPV